jgi:hypothetical protein
MEYQKAVSTGFMRLFAYISGANQNMSRIPMTAPVRVKLTPGAGPFCEDHYKVRGANLAIWPPRASAGPASPLFSCSKSQQTQIRDSLDTAKATDAGAGCGCPRVRLCRQTARRRSPPSRPLAAQVSFFAPFDLQDGPPEPLDASVYIDAAPASSYYVLSYGGRTKEKEIVDKAISLVDQLKQMGLPFDFSSFFFAGYDSPFR